MNFANPHYFSAILDGITHRFILVMESEAAKGHNGYVPPRFTVGGMNGTRDPRLSTLKQLMEVGVKKSALQIPPNWVMVHQFIYIIHENTDEFGWQYRHQWPYAVPGPKDEPWSPKQNSSSRVRRRIWMTTVVPRQDLVRAKRYLAENLRIDNGMIKKQGDLYRYEKGTLTKSWHKRKVVLYHNRLEFYSGNNKKGEVLLNDVEVKMLFESQCQGRKYAFSIRNATGAVGVLLDAEDEAVRRSWVMAIQYQLAVTSHEVNFAPLEIAPPTGESPDSRVLISGDLMLQGSDGTWIPRHFQLTPRELIYYQDTTLKGRIFIEQAKIITEERLLTFSVTSSSGITFNLIAGNVEAKNVWIQGISKQVQIIENQKLKSKTVPKEEQTDDISPIDRLAQLRESNWQAPAVDGESVDYLKKLFNASDQNNPDVSEFSDELGIVDPRVLKNSRQSGASYASHLSHISSTTAHSGSTSSKLLAAGFEQVPPPVDVTTTSSIVATSNQLVPVVVQSSSGSAESPSSVEQRRYSQLLQTKSFLFSAESKLLDPKRNLINPRFMLASLKGITHRFVLVMESEFRETSKREIRLLAPPRFTVGGPRASKDPRTVNINQLIGVTNTLPEIQLPAGWFMLHQYIYIVQQNTDDFGWQYRSTWSDGALKSSDEQWVDTHDDTKFVRRRLWMTTVVKRDDIISGKRMVYEELNKVKGEVIYQEFLFFYHPGVTENDPDWHRRKVILYHDKIEFFAENNKIGEASLHDCEVQLLMGEDNMGKDNAFRIRHPNGSVDVILAADSRAIMLRWVKALKYQFSITTADLNFEPFLYGPPTGELPESRVIFCGELEVSDNITGAGYNVIPHKWEPYQMVLQERLLLCYSRDNLSGRLLLEGAVVKSEEENEFLLKLQGSSLTLRLRAESPDMKMAWIRCLKRQIQYIEYKKTGFTPVSDETLPPHEVFQLYKDPDWIASEINYQEDELHMETVRSSYNAKLIQVWNGPSSSPTNTYTSPASHALPTRSQALPAGSANQLTHGQSIANIVVTGSHNVYHSQPHEGEISSVDVQKSGKPDDHYNDYYSVYGTSQTTKEIADRRTGYMPTPNISDVSEKAPSKNSTIVNVVTPPQPPARPTQADKPLVPVPVAFRDIVIEDDEEEEKADVVINRLVIKSEAELPPMDLDLDDDDEFGEIEEIIDIPRKSPTPPHQHGELHTTTTAVTTTTYTVITEELDEFGNVNGRHEEVTDEVISDPVIMEDTIEIVEPEILEHGPVTPVLTTTTQKVEVLETKVLHGAHVPVAKEEIVLRPVSPKSFATLNTGESALPAVVLKPTTPRVVESSSSQRKNSDLYQNELFQRKAAEAEYGNRPVSGGSNVSFNLRRELEEGDSDDEDGAPYHRHSGSSAHSNKLSVASNDPNDLALYAANNEIDHEEFYRRWHKSMELDTQAEYEKDPALASSSLFGGRDKSAMMMGGGGSGTASGSSTVNLGTPGDRDSDNIKRNSLEEYLKKQLSNDEYDSFMITAKNLRHVDEELLQRERTKDSQDSITPIQFVQLRSVGGRESEYGESEVEVVPQKEKEKESTETIYQTVKLRTVPKEVIHTPTQPTEDNNILKQVKLRSVPSKIKQEVGLISLPVALADDSNTISDISNPPSNFTSPLHSATSQVAPFRFDEVQVKSKIQMFEKSPAQNSPQPLTKGRNPSIVKSIQNNFQQQQQQANNSTYQYITPSNNNPTTPKDNKVPAYMWNPPKK
eukprot:gene4390-4706_t